MSIDSSNSNLGHLWRTNNKPFVNKRNIFCTKLPKINVSIAVWMSNRFPLNLLSGCRTNRPIPVYSGPSVVVFFIKSDDLWSKIDFQPFRCPQSEWSLIDDQLSNRSEIALVSSAVITTTSFTTFLLDLVITRHTIATTSTTWTHMMLSCGEWHQYTQLEVVEEECCRIPCKHTHTHEHAESVQLRDKCIYDELVCSTIADNNNSYVMSQNVCSYFFVRSKHLHWHRLSRVRSAARGGQRARER